jgi:hypothetical protein
LVVRLIPNCCVCPSAIGKAHAMAILRCCSFAISYASSTASARSPSWLKMIAKSKIFSRVCLTKSRPRRKSIPFSTSFRLVLSWCTTPARLIFSSRCFRLRRTTLTPVRLVSCQLSLPPIVGFSLHARAVGSQAPDSGRYQHSALPKSRFSTKRPSSHFVPIPLVPTKALIGPCKRNSLNAVPALTDWQRRFGYALNSLAILKGML